MSLRTKDPRQSSSSSSTPESSKKTSSSTPQHSSSSSLESSGPSTLPPWQSVDSRTSTKKSVSFPKKSTQKTTSSSEVKVSGVSASSSGPIIGEEIDSMKLTKTMMTFAHGTLVVYKKVPYLVGDLQPFPLKLILYKFGGGTKKVKPCPEITPVEEVAGKTFNNMEEVPMEIIERYLFQCMTLVGGEPSFKNVLLDSGDFLTKKIRIRPMGKLSRKFVRVMKEEFCELTFGKNPFRGVPLVITTSFPSPDRGYCQKYDKKLNKANGMILIYSSGEPPPYRKSADTKAGKYISYKNCWIIQAPNIGNMDRIQKQIVLGLCAIGCDVGEKLHLPN